MTDILYTVRPANLRAHLFEVTLTIEHPQPRQRVSMPVWIPGSYLVREFARHLQNLTATQNESAVRITQLDKCRWEMDCTSAHQLVVRYSVYARDDSVRACWLDQERGFFNGTGLLLRVDSAAERAHILRIEEPHADQGCAGWQLATALQPDNVAASGFGCYNAASYAELVDEPVEMGRFWSGYFTACGVPHRVVVSGAAPTFDGQRFLRDVQTICETEIRFWHPSGETPPHDRYVFLLNAVDDGYGGLEHPHSTALICNRADLPRIGAKAGMTDGYRTLLGLVSHEYFHTWNVKRLRPAELTPYDYSAENYTRLLWFFEGFTSYYDDLLLRRTGLIGDAEYLKLVTKTHDQVEQAPGRLVQSVADASFDAWVKFYRQDENTANATISYYAKGALIAMCLDLTLRAEGHGSLDDVMRLLWSRHGPGAITEENIARALQTVGQRSFSAEIASWVHGTDALPVAALLHGMGIASLDEPAQTAQRLGLRVTEANGSVRIKVVLRDGAAEHAGFCAGDEWLGIELSNTGSSAGSAWRLKRLEDLDQWTAGLERCVALVARDGRILRLPLALPSGIVTSRFVVRTPALVSRWLQTDLPADAPFPSDEIEIA